MMLPMREGGRLVGACCHSGGATLRGTRVGPHPDSGYHHPDYSFHYTYFKKCTVTLT